MRQRITVLMDPETIEMVRKYASRYHLSQSATISLLAHQGDEHIRQMDRDRPPTTPD